MIKAVIFDFFGVLAIRGTASFSRTFYNADQKKLNRHKIAEDNLNRGQIGYEKFIEELAEIGGVDRDTVLKYTEEYAPNTELLDYIRTRLKPNWKLGII